MNRSQYFDFIESSLSLLATRLRMRGGLNILDLNLHSENFYLHFFKVLFGWELENLNAVQQNSPGIDLVDNTNKIVVQVSATATKQRIESALTKDLSAYKGYSFKFMSICEDAQELRTKTFLNPHDLLFSPAKDIFDIRSLLARIGPMEIGHQRSVYEFLKKELKCEPDPEKVESNLATLITILSAEDWYLGVSDFEVIPYDIEAKISYNQLDAARVLIDDYKIHYPRIEKIYSSYDKQGANKSLSILNGIRREYLALHSADSPDERFFATVQNVIQKIRASANYTPVIEEELALCVEILVVDAFIRCKIFANPLGDEDACS